ncbi:hypothetical protein H4R19_000109 [Coemansia spiralis]|nr:hypothetical protein H4R19_000109 [Coemansia spiralis]
MFSPSGGRAHRPGSGLGISMALSGKRTAGPGPGARPGTAHVQSRQSQKGRRASHGPLRDFAAGNEDRAETAPALARPSTSSARLGQTMQPRLSQSQPRRHPGGALEPPGGTRGLSMFIPGPQAAAPPRTQRPITVYNPASRLIQLSRDDVRRSRLFSEYECLVARKDVGDDADDEDDDASGDEDDDDDEVSDAFAHHPLSNNYPRPSTAIAATAAFQHQPSDLTSIVEESDGSSSSFEDVVGARSAAGLRPATAQRPPDQAPRQQRDRHAASMYAQGGLFSQQQEEEQQQQTERRWSRIISQNQHLFSAHPVPEPDRDVWPHESTRRQAPETPAVDTGPPQLPAAQSLVLDLPQSADLFHDVSQALAERLPPLSAESTESTSSASTVVLRRDSLTSSVPLSVLQRPQTAAGRAASGADPEPDSSPGSDNQGDNLGDNLGGSGPAAAKRTSIYIDPESLFGGVIFGSEELFGEAAQQEPSTEYTPTIAANSLPSEELGAESSSTSSNGESDATDDNHNDDEAARRASHLRLQAREELRRVEARTPAAELGAALSKGNQAHRELLAAYMERFDFGEQPIDFALRQLFQELRLPSESQQIDRIITGFAECYHERNPGLFHSAEVVYAYAFAILLLHTDAHNPRVKHKITKPQFTARARLLDDSAPGQGSEMFDEVLDVLYDNVTMVKFEYAPAVGGESPAAAHQPWRVAPAAAAAARHIPPASPAAADGARDQSPGISGWLRRMFAPASTPATPTTPTKLPLSPQGIPSKEQYSYTTVGRRRVGSVSGPNCSTATLGAAAPASLASRPCTSHGTFPRCASGPVATVAAAAGGLDEVRAALATSVVFPRARAHTAAPAQEPPALTPIDTSGARLTCGDARLGGGSLTAASDGGPLARDVLRVSAARPFKSSPLAGSPGPGAPRSSGSGGRNESAPSSPASEAMTPTSPRGTIDLASSFAAIDLAVPAQPLAVESIRLKGVKSHVRRRVSLRQGRPLSGIIYPPPGADHGPPGGLERSPPAGQAAGSALLRVDMAGYVTRKMDRLDNGRRGLVRRWKRFWMVLSGSRLYMFRPGDAAHPDCPPEPTSPDTSAPQLAAAAARAALAIQTIVSLRNGVAIVDAAYTKYPHVFRILADDGSEMLVKAPDDDAVAEWMARINCAAAFKTADVSRRTLDAAGDAGADAGSAHRAQLLEGRLAALDRQLDDIDDRLERSLRLFKQLASMVPLTRQGRARTIQHAEQSRRRLKELYLSEQRLTCYKDVLELDLAIEYELSAQSVPAAASPHHPYHPPSLELDGYVAPTHGAAALGLMMAAALAVLLAAADAALRRRHPRLARADRAAALWFVLCGALHCGFELYYLAHFRTILATHDVVGQMWKEYAKSDSRYVAQSSVVRALETVTVAAVGPLCWTAAYGVWTERAATRHLAQLAASVLHAYSVVLYYGTELLAARAGRSSCRPEALYFVGYFLLANLPWLVVPVWLGVASATRITQWMAVAQRAAPVPLVPPGGAPISAAHKAGSPGVRDQPTIGSGGRE